jgi:small subunit ribosomal protein S20
MANTSSAKKAVRKIARRTFINRARRSRMRTLVRKVEEAIATGDAAAAASALQNAAPIMMRAAQQGILHKNTASRKVSRLTVDFIIEIVEPASAGSFCAAPRARC